MFDLLESREKSRGSKWKDAGRDEDSKKRRLHEGETEVAEPDKGEDRGQSAGTAYDNIAGPGDDDDNNQASVEENGSGGTSPPGLSGNKDV